MAGRSIAIGSSCIVRKGHPFKKVNRLWSEHLIRTENELEIHWTVMVSTSQSVGNYRPYT